MKRLLKYAKKYWYMYTIGTVLLGLSILLDFQNPVIMGRIIDEVVIARDLSVFRSLITGILLITLGRAIFGYIRELMFDLGGFNVTRDMRQDLFDHIQKLSENFFVKRTTGELMSRVKEDPEKIWYGVSFGLMLVVEMCIYFIVATIMMMTISLKLSLFVLAVMPIVGFLAKRLESTIGKVFGEISEQNAKLNTVAQENISGVRLVKAFAREKYEAHKFLEQNKEYYNLNIKQMKIWSRFFPTIEFIYNLLIVFVIVIGGAFVIGEELTLGTLVRFSQYTYMVIWPMRLLGWLSSLMAEAGASVKKINLIFDEKPVIESKEDAIVKEHLSGNIEFNQVGLSFDKKEVLKDISFTIEAGKSLAIMGAAGSGKSLIVSLLCRFYDASEGSITIDDINVKDLNVGSLRSNIAMVMQDTFLFSDTIEENIRLGGKDYITPEIMTIAAENAQAHDFISLMEQSYETVIGEKGIGLSGGQKQRISMARAFAKNAPILVFDDSTSALDMDTEKHVQQAISDLNGVTTIVIAHRISAVMNADEIIVLEDGEIVERGTHTSLLDKKGSYFETYIEQYEGYEAYDRYKKEQVG